jgi:hypothetical protein
MWFDLPHIFFLRNVSFLKEMNEILSKMYIGLRIKCLLFLAEFTETCIFSTDFRKLLRYTTASNRNEYQAYFLGVKAAGA